jgi:hypothetical protein
MLVKGSPRRGAIGGIEHPGGQFGVRQCEIRGRGNCASSFNARPFQHAPPGGSTQETTVVSG